MNLRDTGSHDSQVTGWIWKALTPLTFPRPLHLFTGEVPKTAPRRSTMFFLSSGSRVFKTAAGCRLEGIILKYTCVFPEPWFNKGINATV